MIFYLANIYTDKYALQRIYRKQKTLAVICSKFLVLITHLKNIIAYDNILIKLRLNKRLTPEVTNF